MPKPRPKKNPLGVWISVYLGDDGNALDLKKGIRVAAAEAEISASEWIRQACIASLSR